MATWFWYAIAAAILYGLHQVFTKLAANYISDGLGGLVVEATATVTIAIYLVFLWLTNTWTQKATSIGMWQARGRQAGSMGLGNVRDLNPGDCESH